MKCSLSLEPSLAQAGTQEEEWPERLEAAAAEVLAEFAGGVAAARPEIEQEGDDVAATVGMGGAAWGALSVRCSAGLARRLAWRMLGLARPSEKQIAVALGEIAWRIARRIRARYIRPAEECLLSAPGFVAGEEEYEYRDERESWLVAVGFEGLPMWVRLWLEA